MFGVVLAAAAVAQVDEYQVKSAFLFNFAKFVEWPEQAFKTPDDPILICILGQNPFGKTLEQTIGGKAVNGRKFALVHLTENQDLCKCRILFVNPAERRRFRTRIAALKGAGVLTVGEGDGFTGDGGVISFKLEGGRIRLEINVSAAEYENLRISSKLLSIATVVRRAP